ncbi:hypothetical protein BZA77DRAFT_377758 [Pyronema omphalodes]|nr:hypothetical protein BZA77DRAFT_377758 [Pyronema omphalodes]
MHFSTVAVVLAFASSALGAAVGTCPPWREDKHYLLPDDSDCTVFWKCNPWGPVKIDCPKGLYFATQNNWCDYKENAICYKKH